jgi:hypothetical protein
MVRNFVFSKKEPGGGPLYRHPVSFPPLASTQIRNHADSGTVVKLQEGGVASRGNDTSGSGSPPSLPCPVDEEGPTQDTSEEDGGHDDKSNNDMNVLLKTPIVSSVDSTASNYQTPWKNFRTHNLVSGDDDSSPDASSQKVPPSSTVAVTAAATTSRASSVDIVSTLSRHTKASPSRSLAGANAMIEMLKQEHDMRMEEVAELKGQNSELVVEKKVLEDNVKDRDGIIAALQKENVALVHAKQEAENHATDLTSVLLLAQQAHDILGGIFLRRSASRINKQQQNIHDEAAGDGENNDGSSKNHETNSSSSNKSEAKIPVVTTTVEGGTVLSSLEPLQPSTKEKSTVMVAGTSKKSKPNDSATATTTTNMAASSVDGDTMSNCDQPSSPPVQVSPGNEWLLCIRQYWENPENYPLDTIDVDKVASSWKPRVTNPRQEVMLLSNTSNFNNDEETSRFEKGKIIGNGDRGWTVEFPNGDTTNTYKKCLFPHPDLINQLGEHGALNVDY